MNSHAYVILAAAKGLLSTTSQTRLEMEDIKYVCVGIIPRSGWVQDGGVAGEIIPHDISHAVPVCCRYICNIYSAENHRFPVIH